MSIKIEFHVLQSFPPANLNRDDANMPKDCEFGGVRRARISSQCIKRAIRMHPDFKKYTMYETSFRTRLLANKLAEKLITLGKSDEKAYKVALVYAAELLGGIDKDDIESKKTRVLFYFTTDEINQITNDIVSDWDEIVKIVDKIDLNTHVIGKFKKPEQRKLESYINKSITKFKNETRNFPDIALFGRMLALRPKLALEASCQVAHAISTHRVSMEMDYFTAVDDLQTTDDAGAGMIGVTGFNSATFYRYAAIDWDQLRKNLGDDITLARNTVTGFAFALAKAVPTGKQNAFAANTLPAMILIVVREDGQAWSLANAFEKPIYPDNQQSILQKSMAALAHHWCRLNQIYGEPTKPVKAFILTHDEEADINCLNGNQVNSLSELVDAISAELPQR